MNDQQRWDQACKAVHEIHDRLPASHRESLAVLIDRIMQLKEELLEIALAVGSSSICGDCGGKCCLYGKYHFSMMDLMAYLFVDVKPPAPVFENGAFCPYGTDSGCMMLPAFRPVTCVLFNCEQIDERLICDNRDGYNNRERLLRETVLQAEQLLDMRVGRPLLLSIEK